MKRIDARPVEVFSARALHYLDRLDRAVRTKECERIWSLVVQSSETGGIGPVVSASPQTSGDEYAQRTADLVAAEDEWSYMYLGYTPQDTVPVRSGQMTSWLPYRRPITGTASYVEEPLPLPMTVPATHRVGIVTAYDRHFGLIKVGFSDGHETDWLPGSHHECAMVVIRGDGTLVAL